MQLTLPLLAADYHTVLVRHRKARRYIIRVVDDATVRVTVPWRGSRREALAFAEKSVEWIAKQRARLFRQPGSLQPSAHASGFGDTGSFTRAKTELPRQLLALAHTHDISVGRVSIRNQRSRWGACSARRSITLNWRLILVPEFVREYVMIHELMHCRELNHSKRFWGHVRAACPRYREARQWLLTEGQRLFS